MKKIIYQRYLKENPKEFHEYFNQQTQNNYEPLNNNIIKNPLIEYDSKLARSIKLELKKSDKNRLYKRKNPWGHLTYTDLITRSIQSSINTKLTLCEIYQWFRIYVPYFSDADNNTIRRMKVIIENQ